MPRKFTCKILDLMDEGVLDPSWLVQGLLTYMSEHEVQDFYHTIGLTEIEEIEDSDDE